MGRMTLFDEFHLTVSAPSRLPDSEGAAIKRVLDSKGFHQALTRAMHTVIRRYRALRRVRVRLSR